MANNACEDCPKSGSLGDAIRTYVQKTPSKRTEPILCFKCFTARAKRFGASRKQWIRDKVYLRPVTERQSP